MKHALGLFAAAALCACGGVSSNGNASDNSHATLLPRLGASAASRRVTAGPGGTWVYANGATGCVNTATTRCEYLPGKQDPMPSGTVYYFCDCQPGAASGCVPGNDANRGLSPSSPKRNLTVVSGSTVTPVLENLFSSLTAGGGVALCRGGAWPSAVSFNLANANGTASARIYFRDYVAPWNTGAEPRPLLPGSIGLSNNAQLSYTTIENIAAWGVGSWNAADRTTNTSHIIIRNMDFDGALGNGGGVTKAGVGPSSACTTIANCDSDWLVEGSRFQNLYFGILGAGSSKMYVVNSYFRNCGDHSSTDHAIYWGGARILGNAAQTDFLIQGCEFHNQPNTAGTVIVVHGVHDGFQVTGNVFLEDEGKPGDGGWNIAFNPGYSGQGMGEVNRNVLISRNVSIGGGNNNISLSSCQTCTVENNLVITTAQARAISAPDPGYEDACRATPADCLLSSNITVRNNTVYAPVAGSYGIQAGASGTGNLVENNALQVNGTCVNVGSGGALLQDYNLFYGCADTPTGAHSTTQAPLWVNPGTSPTNSFVPSSNSPLIGAGDPGQKPQVDLAGLTRPAHPAIGAFEPAAPSNTAPTITGFAASPTSTAPGGAVTLSWSYSGTSPTAASIDNGVGSVLGQTSITVYPAVTTTYTLTASNSFGTATPAAVTVTVSSGSGVGLVGGNANLLSLADETSPYNQTTGEWDTPGTGITFTPNYAAGPGTSGQHATRIQFARTSYLSVGLGPPKYGSPNTAYTFSIYARATTSSSMSGVTLKDMNGVDEALTTTWARFSWQTTSDSGGMITLYNIFAMPMNPAGSADFLVWGAKLEQGTVATGSPP